MNQRELFLQHVAQTSPAPMGFEVAKAEGSLLFDSTGKSYIDLIGGISVANTGHRHPRVIEAIQKQLDSYLHVMVYGEFIESPQVEYAKLLVDHLPPSLNSVYFTNSGAEAVEGAMKLAKRVTNRGSIIAFNRSYHGSTQGALSVMGDEYWRNAFRPLLPNVSHLEYNSLDALKEINDQTACVIVEPVQAEAGINVPSGEWLLALSQKCTDAGTLLILDEIQTGFGRTGKMWAFQQFNIVPDILLLGKALGGGMPLGAFISDKKLMQTLTENPVLGHITTFGGHPVCCAAGMAAMQVILEEKLMGNVKEKETLFRSLLVHPKIKSIRSFGLWLAVEFETFEECKRVIDASANWSGHILDSKHALASPQWPDQSKPSEWPDQLGGIMTDWFLFAPNCLRISPPLNIPEDLIRKACSIIIQSLG